MKLNTRKTAVVLLVGIALPALGGTTYTWTANGANDNFNNTDNWNPTGWPSGTDDSAIFGSSSGPYTTILTQSNHFITNLTVNVDTTFTASTTRTLHAETITINGPASGDDPTEATIGYSGVTIDTYGL